MALRYSFLGSLFTLASLLASGATTAFSYNLGTAPGKPTGAVGPGAKRPLQRPSPRPAERAPGPLHQDQHAGTNARAQGHPTSERGRPPVRAEQWYYRGHLQTVGEDDG